ncbi:MAG: NAD-dependent epimerase/dehydratase family protein [bacterium]
MTSRCAVVTGASGFLGAHVVRRLLDLGRSVRVLVRSDAQRAKLPTGAIDVVVGDLRDESSMAGLCRDADVVFHLGTTMAFGLTDSDLRDVNVGGTERVIQLAIADQVPRFVLVSSGGVHHNPFGEPLDEASTCAPENVYLESKLEAEAIARRLYRSDPGRLTIVRPSLVYGPGDWRRVKLWRAVARGYFVMVGPGTTFIHPVYCEDLVDGLLLAAGDRGRGETFLLGGPQALTLRAFVNEIAHAAGRSLLPLRIPARPVQLAAALCESVCRPFGLSPPLSARRLSFFLKHRRYDIRKARAMLGYDPPTGVADGVRRTLSWYRERGWL